MPFARSTRPLTLREAFAELVAALGLACEMPAITAEVLWSALHGMAVLAQSERIPAQGAAFRLDVLVQTFS
jgi:hypothetical protein